jgi:hypothetical protein
VLLVEVLVVVLVVAAAAEKASNATQLAAPVAIKGLLLNKCWNAIAHTIVSNLRIVVGGVVLVGRVRGDGDVVVVVVDDVAVDDVIVVVFVLGYNIVL